MDAEKIDADTLGVLIQEGRKRNISDYEIARCLEISMTDDAFGHETIAAEFIDEHGMGLAERLRRTTFLDGKRWIRFGDPEHVEIRHQHEAAMVQETARLVDAMKGAKFSAWFAALRIVGVRHGINIPLRPGDRDPDEPGTI